MKDWTSGYVADIGYTYGYYVELNPLLTRLALLSAGIVPPEIGFACELGFGQGLSVNIHAAASSTQWWGTDFNPSQAGFARELAAASGAAARLFDESFEEFCRRDDIPEMDFIGLHGIWSWISDANRALIVDFVRRKLKVGGVLYVSYNTQPGWASVVPLRDLLTEHADVMGVQGQGTLARIDGALSFAQKLLGAQPGYAKANPQITERLNRIAGQERNYLAHEYFNRDWEPMSFARMGDRLAVAKLGFACSANLLEHVDAIQLTAEQQALLREIPDRMFRETVRDFCINQQFRRDIWVRGVRYLDGVTQRTMLEDIRVVLLRHPRDIQLSVSGAQAEAKLADAIYTPILEFIADGRAVSIGELARRVGTRGVNFPQMLQALAVLTGKGDVHPAQAEGAVQAASDKARRLNLHLLQAARGSGNVSFLASPVTGGGVAVNRLEQLFMLALHEGEGSVEGWVRNAWRDLSAQGQRIVRAGSPIETAEENLAELKQLAQVFAERRLPILRSLQVL